MSNFSHPAVVVEDQTNLEAVHFTLKWSIHDFEGLKNKTGTIFSTGITMAELGMEEGYRGRWRIAIRPCTTKTRTIDAVKSLVVFLWLTDEDLKSTVYTGERALSFVSKQRIVSGKLMDKPLFAEKEFGALYTFSPDGNARDLIVWEIDHPDLFGAGGQAGWLKDSCLHIAMDVIVYREPKTIRASETASPSLLQRYQEFIGRLRKQHGAGGDFLLISNDKKEFHVDRSFLMAHSPVFAAMLTHDSKEKQTSRCEMKDVDGECVEILLDYVYGCETGKIQGSNAENVLMMADKYEMVDLRAVCELTLADNIMVDNAVHIFALARQRNLGKLKDVALKFIRKNLDVEKVLDESL